MRDSMICVDHHRLTRICHSMQQWKASNRHVPRAEEYGVTRDTQYRVQTEGFLPWLISGKKSIDWAS